MCRKGAQYFGCKKPRLISWKAETSSRCVACCLAASENFKGTAQNKVQIAFERSPEGKSSFCCFFYFLFFVEKEANQCKGCKTEQQSRQINNYNEVFYQTAFKRFDKKCFTFKLSTQFSLRDSLFVIKRKVVNLPKPSYFFPLLGHNKNCWVILIIKMLLGHKLGCFG